MQLVDVISSLWIKRHTFKSLVGFIIVLNSIFFVLVPTIYKIFSASEKLVSAEQKIQFFTTSAIIIGISNILLIGVWLFWRSNPFIAGNKIGIIFAPHYNAECNTLIHNLFEEFKVELGNSKYNNYFKIKFLPEFKKIQNDDDALNLVLKSKARILIYGYYQTGKIKNEDSQGFTSISFTLRHRKLANEEKKTYLDDVASALAYRSFVVKEKNSFIEKSVVINNLSEVVRFFISLGLTLDGKSDFAIPLLEELREKNEHKIKISHSIDQLRIFNRAVISCLEINFRAKLITLYRNELIDNITLRELDETALKIQNILNNLFQLNKRFSEYYLMQAIIHFHFGKLQDSKDAVIRAKKLSPINSSKPHFSFAFLYMWNEDYVNAIRSYRKAEKCSDAQIISIMDILLFLQGVLKLHPDKIQLFFSLGYLNEKYFDKSQSVNDYKVFLMKSENDPKLNYLRELVKISLSKNKIN